MNKWKTVKQNNAPKMKIKYHQNIYKIKKKIFFLYIGSVVALISKSYFDKSIYI